MQNSERIFAARKPTIDGQVVWLQRRSFAAPPVGARVRCQRQRSSEACVKISVTEGLLQCRECWLARAMARRNAFDLEGIFQSRHCLCDNLVRRDDKVETAGNQMNFRIDSCSGLDNLLDPWMRAADHQYHALRGAHGKR